MNQHTNNFWRGFTRKNFLLWSLYWFAGTLTVAVILNYFDSPASIAHHFTAMSLIKRMIGSLVSGFFSALWMEPKTKSISAPLS